MSLSDCNINGIICIDKPAGITSFDVVSRLRHVTGQRRIGHAGTLDPMATGLLPVFIGQATKVIALLPDHSKAYVASFRLGVVTDTGDITGRVLSRREVGAGYEAVEEAVASFKGEIMQVPPMYSAIKQGGRRLYELAREGLDVERAPRPVEIYDIALRGRSGENEYVMEVRCSQGTYIRALCEDIGKKLGSGATMTALRRIAACGFGLEQAHTLEQVEEAAAQGRLDQLILDVEKPFDMLDSIEVTEKQAVRFLNGGALMLSRLRGSPREGLCRVRACGRFLGLGSVDAKRQELRAICHFSGGRLDGNYKAGQ